MQFFLFVLVFATATLKFPGLSHPNYSSFPTRFKTNFRFIQVLIDRLACVVYCYNETRHSKTNKKVYMQ